MKTIHVTCPTCQKSFEYYSSKFRPFCCEKCKLIDLGQWLSESYTVPVQKLTEEEAETLRRTVNEEKNEEDD